MEHARNVSFHGAAEQTQLMWERTCSGGEGSRRQEGDGISMRVPDAAVIADF